MTARYIVWFVTDSPLPKPPGAWEKSGITREDGAGLVGFGFASEKPGVNQKVQMPTNFGKIRTRVRRVRVPAEVVPGRCAGEHAGRWRRQEPYSNVVARQAVVATRVVQEVKCLAGHDNCPVRGVGDRALREVPLLNWCGTSRGQQAGQECDEGKCASEHLCVFELSEDKRKRVSKVVFGSS